MRRIDDACGGNPAEKKAAVEALHQASDGFGSRWLGLRSWGLFSVWFWYGREACVECLRAEGIGGKELQFHRVQEKTGTHNEGRECGLKGGNRWRQLE